MKQIKYLQILRNLNILKELLLQDRYKDIEEKYSYLFSLNVEGEVGKTVFHNLKILRLIVKNKNYGKSIEVTSLIIKALEKRIFEFKCERKLEDFISIPNQSTKFCIECSKHVYKVDNESELRKRMQLGQCIFYTPNSENIENIKSCNTEVEEEEFWGGLPCTIENMESHSSDERLPFGIDEKYFSKSELDKLL